MAQQLLDVGTSSGSGDGEPLRLGMIKVNNNFTELYARSVENGYAYYKDGETVTATQTFNSTPSKLLIDGLSTNTYITQLPTGVSALWSVDHITPDTLGDSYDVRIDLSITAKTGSPSTIKAVLDIGGGTTITNEILNDKDDITLSAPFSTTLKFPVFCKTTFLANGGQFFISTDSGSVTVSGRAIFIKRDYKGKTV